MATKLAAIGSHVEITSIEFYVQYRYAISYFSQTHHFESDTLKRAYTRTHCCFALASFELLIHSDVPYNTYNGSELLNFDIQTNKQHFLITVLNQIIFQKINIH